MRTWIALTLIFAFAGGISVQAQEGAETMNPKVTLKTSKGDVVLELFTTEAPKTVANFLGYVRSGHYDGVIFHRVIPGFMLQTGGYSESLEERPSGEPIQNEADNGLTNQRGTVAMARTSDPHSAKAQFFINLVDNAYLNHTSPTPQGWGYAVFGKVVEGMEVVDAIAAVPTRRRGVFEALPTEPVKIEKATLQE